MKKLTFASVLLFIMTPVLLAGSRDDQWRKVDEAINKGLPKTAIAELEPIIQGALADKAWGEAAKAIARKIVLQGNIEGNKPEEKIPRLEAEIGRAPREMKPLLRTIQANWYWHYFQHNRWRFMQRTATAAAPGTDFTTWDLPLLFAEIDRQFQAALTDADTLKKTPVSAFDDLLEKGALPDRYRPTLYDFIAHDALKFYTSGEQAAAKPQDAFELPASSPALGDAEEFLKWWRTFAFKSFPNAPAVKALDLYGRLLAFHENDKDPSAFADADLARLQFAYNTAFGEEKAARYKAALKAFAEKNADHELSALALHRWAGVVKGEGNFVEARELAMRGQKAFPESPGGRLCHNLIQDIEAKSAPITTERVWNKPMPKITVRYRNVTQVFFRAVAWDWNEFLAKDRSRPEWLDDRERKELLSRKPSLEWSAKLPPTPDFKERVERLPAPASLKPGHYFIVSSHDASFGDKDNQISYTNVWVSDLGLVVVTHEGKVSGFVLDAASGEPIADAEVVAWRLDRGVRVLHGTAHTDANGCFSFPTGEHRPLLLRARARGHEIGSQEEYRSYHYDQRRVESQAIFFTDRAIYRPGQTVSYKGILIRVDQKGDNYETLADRRVEVVFEDPNGKEVAKAPHTPSGCCTCTGIFTSPPDLVMGQYQIRLISGGQGATWFSIEEYKRPKFQVTLDAPKTAPKLNDKVSLQGKAEAYTGAAVDGAKVRWRVVREVRWPYWWHWWDWRGGRGRGSESQEIAHGTAATATDGTFKVEFTAKPDPQVEEKSEASFCFRVYADVTDTAGETRSADRGVNVGFTALLARVEVDEWQTDAKPVELRIRTATLDDEPQAAKGIVKIYRLSEPKRVQRPPLASRRYYYSPEADGADEEKDQSDPNNWPLGEVVAELKWSADAEGKAAVSTNLGLGVYRAMLETQDRFGKKVTARAQITVLRPGAERLAIKLPHLVSAPKWQVEPGDEFMALWGTGYDTGRAFVEIERRRQMIQRYWTKPGATQQQIKLAVAETMRGGFTIHITQIRENRAYLTSRRVDVPWSNKELAVKWEHFTSKLQPGQKETWTAVIRDPLSVTRNSGRGTKATSTNHESRVTSHELRTAEMVATLYDESLDAYRKHDWLRRLNVFYNDFSDRRADFGNIAKQFQHMRGNWQRDYLGVDMRYRDFPADLGRERVGLRLGFWQSQDDESGERRNGR
ncbi:MAG: MG2 domain-containing protein [Verrucomicrobiae bacterium]|nr:MG2 domain-containing protein [Verrucomicrobiae bacterium]